MIDGMAIKKHVTYDSRTMSAVGYVDLGSGPSEDGEEAKEALVILAVGLKARWKAAISYYLIDRITSETQSQLVKHAVEALQNIGMKVSFFLAIQM